MDRLWRSTCVRPEVESGKAGWFARLFQSPVAVKVSGMRG
jgi:hypothetical protein